MAMLKFDNYRNFAKVISSESESEHWKSESENSYAQDGNVEV